jgi:hypothetical protein
MVKIEAPPLDVACPSKSDEEKIGAAGPWIATVAILAAV